MGGNVISNHGTPGGANDVANKDYVDNVAGGGVAPGTFLEVAGDTMAGDIDMDGNSIIGLPAPVNPNDAARKDYVDTEVAGVVTSIGEIVQIVRTPTTAVIVLPTASIVVNDDIPQNTDGDEITALNTTITPTDASNLLKIEFNVIWGHSGDNTNLVFFIVQDAIADALVTTWEIQIGVNFINNTHFTWYTTAGSTAARTYKLRIADAGSPGTTTINGSVSVRRFGGTLTSHMTITEINA